MAMSGGGTSKLRVVYRRRAADDNKVTAGARALTTADLYRCKSPCNCYEFYGHERLFIHQRKNWHRGQEPRRFSRVSTARLPRALGAIEEAPPCGFHSSAS